MLILLGTNVSALNLFGWVTNTESPATFSSFRNAFETAFDTSQIGKDYTSY